MTATQRTNKEPPYKLLALDGGGIRGALTIEILAEIENIVKDKIGNDKNLADYFDCFSGTSTGAIIAAGLSLGWSVDNECSFTCYRLIIHTRQINKRTTRIRCGGLANACLLPVKF